MQNNVQIKFRMNVKNSKDIDFQPIKFKGRYAEGMAVSCR